MVALAERTQKRLTLQQADIAPDTTTLRSQDWDRDRFDIEFELQNGTSSQGCDPGCSFNANIGTGG